MTGVQGLHLSKAVAAEVTAEAEFATLAETLPPKGRHLPCGSEGDRAAQARGALDEVGQVAGGGSLTA